MNTFHMPNEACDRAALAQLNRGHETINQMHLRLKSYIMKAEPHSFSKLTGRPGLSYPSRVASSKYFVNEHKPTSSELSYRSTVRSFAPDMSEYRRSRIAPYEHFGPTRPIGGIDGTFSTLRNSYKFRNFNERSRSPTYQSELSNREQLKEEVQSIVRDYLRSIPEKSLKSTILSATKHGPSKSINNKSKSKKKKKLSSSAIPNKSFKKSTSKPKKIKTTTTQSSIKLRRREDLSKQLASFGASKRSASKKSQSKKIAKSRL